MLVETLNLLTTSSEFFGARSNIQTTWWWKVCEVSREDGIDQVEVVLAWRCWCHDLPATWRICTLLQLPDEIDTDPLDTQQCHVAHYHARLSQRDPNIPRHQHRCLGMKKLGAMPVPLTCELEVRCPPPPMEEGFLSDTCVWYHMKVRKMDAICPSAILSRKVLHDTGGIVFWIGLPSLEALDMQSNFVSLPFNGPWSANCVLYKFVLSWAVGAGRNYQARLRGLPCGKLQAAWGPLPQLGPLERGSEQRCRVKVTINSKDSPVCRVFLSSPQKASGLAKKVMAANAVLKEVDTLYAAAVHLQELGRGDTGGMRLLPR